MTDKKKEDADDYNRPPKDFEEAIGDFADGFVDGFSKTIASPKKWISEFLDSDGKK